jgi:hypothetical protein
MGQHLGFNVKSNVLRRRLEKSGIAPEECEFRLTAHGPILAEAKSPEEHRYARDIVAALEKALADAMATAGYQVINPIHCRMPLDNTLFATVQEHFARQFPRIR